MVMKKANGRSKIVKKTATKSKSKNSPSTKKKSMKGMKKGMKNAAMKKSKAMKNAATMKARMKTVMKAMKKAKKKSKKDRAMIQKDRRKVFRGETNNTIDGLEKKDLIENRRGLIVSKAKSDLGKRYYLKWRENWMETVSEAYENLRMFNPSLKKGEEGKHRVCKPKDENNLTMGNKIYIKAKEIFKQKIENQKALKIETQVTLTKIDENNEKVVEEPKPGDEYRETDEDENQNGLEPIEPRGKRLPGRSDELVRGDRRGGRRIANNVSQPYSLKITRSNSNPDDPLISTKIRRDLDTTPTRRTPTAGHCKKNESKETNIKNKPNHEKDIKDHPLDNSIWESKGFAYIVKKIERSNVVGQPYRSGKVFKVRLGGTNTRKEMNYKFDTKFKADQMTDDSRIWRLTTLESRGTSLDARTTNWFAPVDFDKLAKKKTIIWKDEEKKKSDMTWRLRDDNNIMFVTERCIVDVRGEDKEESPKVNAAYLVPDTPERIHLQQFFSGGNVDLDTRHRKFIPGKKTAELHGLYLPSVKGEKKKNLYIACCCMSTYTNNQNSVNVIYSIKSKEPWAEDKSYKEKLIKHILGEDKKKRWVAIAANQDEEEFWENLCFVEKLERVVNNAVGSDGLCPQLLGETYCSYKVFEGTDLRCFENSEALEIKGMRS